MVTQALLLDFTFEWRFPIGGNAQTRRKQRRQGHVVMFRNKVPVTYKSAGVSNSTLDMIFPAAWMAAEQALAMVAREQARETKQEA